MRTVFNLWTLLLQADTHLANTLKTLSGRNVTVKLERLGDFAFIEAGFGELGHGAELCRGGCWGLAALRRALE